MKETCECDMRVLLSFVCVVCLLKLPQHTDSAESNIGVLVPITGMPFDGRKILVAVPVAVEAAQKQFPSIQFKWSYVDTMCAEAPSVRGALDFPKKFKDDLDVLIGEECSEACEIVAYVASALGKPFISSGCNSDKLSRHDVYGSFSRSVPPFRALVPAFGKLLKEFKWSKAGILATDDPAYQLLSVYIKLYLTGEGMEASMTTTERCPDSDACLQSTNAKEVMKVVKENDRIVILIMDRKDVVYNLLLAKELDMYNGKYAFIAFDFDLIPVRPDEYVFGATADDIYEAQEGLLLVSFQFLNFSADFVNNLNNACDDPNFKDDAAFKNLKIKSDERSVLQYAAHLYDAVMMWAHAKSKSMNDPVPLNYEGLTNLMRRTNFTGMTGHVRFDKNGERIVTVFDFWMIQYGKVINILQYDSSSDTVKQQVNVDELKWPGGETTKPVGAPDCGWHDEDCKDMTETYVIAACSSVMGIFLVGGLLFLCATGIKNYKKNKETIINWRIQWMHIIPIGHNVSTHHITLVPTAYFNDTVDSKTSEGLVNVYGLLSGMTQLFSLAGVYEKKIVAIKLVERDSVSLSDPEIHYELKQMLDMKHDNVNEFIGLCLDAPHVCVLMLYAHKGSLQDIINNESVSLSSELRMALSTDIVKGMEYLHNSDIGAHGHLTSSNCVVNQNWVCRITDYGLKLFKLSPLSDINSYQEALNLMWCSPELLRKDLDDEDRFYGTKQGDVYAFGIIVSELLTVNAPYQQELINLTPSDIVYKVRRRSQPPFRPALSRAGIADKWCDLAETCWQEEPHKRPTFSALKDMLRMMNEGKRVNIMEWLYKTLEESLDTKTNQLAEEKAKTQRWMYSTFPKSMADVLLVGGEVGPQMSDPVTVCFCGVVGMEKLVSTLTPTQIVEAVSGLHGLFDNVLSLYSVHKVGNDTSSEAMLFVSGLPERSLTHAVDMCTLALHLVSAVYSSNVSYVQLQIGISTGAVIGVLIGKLIPRYRIYGRIVHQSLAMQAASQAPKIRISSATNTHLAGMDDHQFVTQNAGYINTKDDEKLDSFWLRDKIGLNMPLPEWKN